MVTEYDKRVIGNYFLKEGMEKGLQQGIEKGLQQGIEKGMEKGMQQGMEKGLAKGRAEEHQKLLAAAKAMLVKRGMSVEDVCELTGLTAEEVGKLIN